MLPPMPSFCTNLLYSVKQKCYPYEIYYKNAPEAFFLWSQYYV